MYSVIYNVWLIPLLPILATSWIALGYIFNFNRGESGEAQTAKTSLTAASLSLILILIIDAYAFLYSAPGQLKLSPWLISGDYTIYISFTLDNFALAMATLISTISLLTIKFSVNYMHREAGFQRFFMILNLFSGAMLLIVMAGNAVFTFIGWELAGVSSFLLIGHSFDRDTATRNANRAFITNRIGDAFFIIAFALSFIWLGSIEWNDILNHNAGLSSLQIGLIAGSFLIAALAKSALFPFSPWIARALEGPTPSSAIFYGSLMVHAGIYLVIRIEPLFVIDTALLPLLVLIGLLTTLYGFFTSLVQTDVKSTLIFSVTTHVGLMLFICGLGLFELASWYLILHAIWRAYQFLNAPAHMHMMSRPTRKVHPLFKNFTRLYTASIQRFWLDHIADWLLVKPIEELSRDARNFDEKVVNRIVGLPAQATTITSLDENETSSDIGKGHGMAGKTMEWLASILGWFEDHLVLQGGEGRFIKLIHHLGGYVLQIDQLLSQPRYLLILIITTFVVIL
ncbi:MAG: proton-conducting transporter membrane subunit [Gammaproteobacteria bacterium]|nr:proton-conducting transporter membrane subunit [Gammaproteobacteria bacterium]MCW9005574.1 proton-conducting transporter membrane subunit [Gammaproteobacteria bacterium]MCW9056945.1 proton-conducting transporter membrane subunit [Gammaproteobacteria bacterium]